MLILEAGSLGEISEQESVLTDMKETKDRPVVFFKAAEENEAEPKSQRRNQGSKREPGSQMQRMQSGLPRPEMDPE